MSDYSPTNWATGDVITAQKMNKIEEGIDTAHTELSDHDADTDKHVIKDGTLEEGLNSDKTDGIHFRNIEDTLEWSADEQTWIPCGSGGSGIKIYAGESDLTGNKKADTLTCDGQCVYDTISSAGDVVLAEVTTDKLDLGMMTLIARIKTANNVLTDEVIKVEVKKNNGGVFSAIAVKNFKPNIFTVTSDYECIFVPFDYKGGRATDNQIKLVVTLLQNLTEFEVCLDYICIVPQAIGVVG